MRDTPAGTLLTLFAVFAPLSLLSFGGSNSVIADIAHQSVVVRHWTSEREFADLFALSRAAPGPGSMLTALIGWKLAGLAGAVVATVSFYGPAALLLFAAAKMWGRWRGSLWHQAVERGMAPIAAGLFLSGGIAVLRASPAGAAVWIAAGVTTAALVYWPKLHPLPLLVASGAAFGLIDMLGVAL
ncbi:MAG TPA: chromate transporter [Stellaceae bacterium]|jgi:chromate transporter|nr:chromate transporter [Stellaceae bacterium]